VVIKTVSSPRRDINGIIGYVLEAEPPEELWMRVGKGVGFGSEPSQLYSRSNGLAIHRYALWAWPAPMQSADRTTRASLIA
jgi:hypothetical protein